MLGTTHEGEEYMQALDELIRGGQKASKLRCFCPESLTRPVTLF